MTDYHLSVKDGKIQTGELVLEGTEEAIETFVAEIPGDVLKELARKWKDYLSKPNQGRLGRRTYRGNDESKL